VVKATRPVLKGAGGSNVARLPTRARNRQEAGMPMSVPQSERWTRRLARRIPRLVLAALIVLLVIAVLFVIVYGLGIQHHHSTGDHRGMLGLLPTL
jgi:hypothetical protein